mmetsp:Transcript_6678/g.11696  ORF Transcript_6678/g.11696 Transcript_6678/m.11696 type:complete len:232 (-) Transcript_6678:72-767(-)
MKLIFLDIDGVLVTRRPGVFEESLLMNLKRIVDTTGADIVLSSDWRRHPSARLEAKRVLNAVGLTFIGCTPCLSAFLAQRPTEIMQWKRDHNKRADAERITHWVVIDDRPLLEERHGNYLRGHFAQTQPMRGLTDAVVDECCRILTQDVPSAPPDPLKGAIEGHSGIPSRGSSTGPVLIPSQGRRGNGSESLPVDSFGRTGKENVGSGNTAPAGMPSRLRGRSTSAVRRSI